MATKIRSTHPLITVTPASRATKLCYASTRDELVGILSIADPVSGNRPPRGVFASFEFGMRMDFDDVEYQPKDGDVLPTAEDVRRILAFGARIMPVLRERQKKLLIHCYAGVSRSSAAALAILAQDKLAQGLPPTRETARLALRELLEACEATPKPNMLMGDFIDAALGFNGALAAVILEQKTNPVLSSFSAGTTGIILLDDD